MEGRNEETPKSRGRVNMPTRGAAIAVGIALGLRRETVSQK